MERIPASRGWEAVARASTVLLEPAVDFVRVEADEVPDFVVRHLPFGDEPADVADAAVDVGGEAGDVEQRSAAIGMIGCSHRSPSMVVITSTYGRRRECAISDRE
jgi:hypothetical protein